jgi:hypothetical protein
VSTVQIVDLIRYRLKIIQCPFGFLQLMMQLLKYLDSSNDNMYEWRNMYICWVGTRRGLFQKRIVSIYLNIYDLFDNHPEL